MAKNAAINIIFHQLFGGALVSIHLKKVFQLGSYANQAIMLVTDNVPEKYKTIFRVRYCIIDII